MSADTLRAELCAYGHRLYAHNLVAATDGNLSARVGDDRYFCTPSGCCKAELEPDLILVADGRGTRIEGTGKVTSEFFTHLAAYEERPDIGAVVHAHPPHATALTLAGVSMARPQLPELVMALGAVPTAPYATPGSPEGGDVIRSLIRSHDAVLLDHHGAVTVGKDLRQAYYNMEKVEHAARILWTALSIGKVADLDSDQLDRIRTARADYGLPPLNQSEV